MLFIYDIPSVCMASIVVGITLLVALIGYLLTPSLRRRELDLDEHAMALTMVSAVTTINSLLIAFAAISVWGTYNDADRTVTAEAACAGELAIDLAAFGSSSADAAGLVLRDYMEHVIHSEWRIMQHESRMDPETGLIFNRMLVAVNRIVPRDVRQTTLFSEVLARANEMVKLRQQRQLALEVSMPTTLWGVIIVVSFLSFLILYLLPSSGFYRKMIAAWAITLGLAFFFVLAVDRPFAGEVSVSSIPFQKSIDALVNIGAWVPKRDD